jgi:hypothetical protein
MTRMSVAQFRVEEARYKSEDTIQREVAAWLDAHLPRSWRWFHVPNGGARSKAAAGRLKAHGVKPGVFDIIICRGREPDIWIELKAHGAYPTKEQREWMAWRESHGLPTHVARSVGAVVTILKDYMARAAA